MLSWKQLYAATVVETRPAELQILVAETERAIYFRLYDIANEPVTTTERLEMDHATAALNILSREIVAWENYQAY